MKKFTTLFLLLIISSQMALAAERDVEAAKLAAMGQAADEMLPRPATLVDLTKGELIPLPPPPDKPAYWHMGPVGVIGLRNGMSYGDQIQVTSVTPGSPAEGKLLRGDVILGVEDKMLSHEKDGIDRLVGDAIIKAEEESSKGLLKINIWRDRNYLNRTGAKDVFALDIDKVLEEAETGSDAVYEWQDEEEKTIAVKQMGFDKYPLDGFFTNITVQLEVMGTYSEDSPWNCPVITKVRENAWKVIAAKLTRDVTTPARKRGKWSDVLALVASGKPEYVALAKKWVHSLPTKGRNAICQDMNKRVSVEDCGGGLVSWYYGFSPLERAIYYDATGDEFVRAQIRRDAIMVALGQNGGGSWGHRFAMPSFNGGMLHKNNPGYGAMNNAGTRCFFLLTLAKKAGIEHPEIDAAIARSDRFFSTFVDKGCIPYGYHSPAGSDDSNGKNYGAAYGFYVLGEKYKSKFFGMHSTHASFTRRGGHGSPTLWFYTPLSANLAGPDAVKAYMRNMRYFYTLSRRYDGSFVFYGKQTPGIGGRGMRNPTATLALHLSYPLKQLVITGKDADPNFWMTKEEMQELLLSARGTSEGGQIGDEYLLKKIGKPWNERGSDELIDTLDHFYPKMRQAIAGELGKRYEAGEKEILSKVVAKLGSDEPRMRAGACLAVSACGIPETLENLSKLVALLKDEAEFVRMNSSKVIAAATEPGQEKRELALLNAVVDDHPQMTMDNGNVKTVIKNILLPRRPPKTGPVSKLLTDPFNAGYDEELVRAAMERIVTMDPQGTVPNTWNKEALIKLAGPVVFAASVLQVNDAMFGGARKSQGQALLRTHGYREAVDGDAYNIKRRRMLERRMRHGVSFKDAYVKPVFVKQAPCLYRDYLDDLYSLLHDEPTFVFQEKLIRAKGAPRLETPLDLLIEIIEKDTDTKQLPSIVPDVKKIFDGKLAAAGNLDAQVKLCRSELADLDRKNFFRKNCAMDFLAEKFGAKAIDDVSPFLGHEQLWLKEHANKVALDLIKKGAGPRLIELYQEAQARKAGTLGNINAAGILYTLAEADYEQALGTAKAALKHSDPVIRKAAIQAVFKIGGDPELRTVFAFIRQASEPEDYDGAEIALLSKRDDPAHVNRVSQAARTLIPRSEAPLRRSLAWVIGQFGGPENMAAIEAAIAAPKDDSDIRELVFALAYSPDQSATDIMKRLVKDDVNARPHVASLCVHRMVGPKGMSGLPNDERVSFAREVLDYKFDSRLLVLLGRIPTGASMKLLYEVMTQGGDAGGKYGATEVACKALIDSAERMHKPSKADAKLATEILTQVIEYIEVTHLRGGVKEHVTEMRDAKPYMIWQDFQGRAGKAILKFHKPKEQKIPTFNDVDLDI